MSSELIVPPVVRDVVCGYAIAIAAVGLWMICGRRRQLRLIVGGIATMIIGGLVLLTAWLAMTDRIVVRDDDGRIAAHPDLVIGLPLHGLGSRTEIVNETDRPLRLVHVPYSADPDENVPLTPIFTDIPPHSSFTSKHGIDDLGPDHVPPTKIKVHGRAGDRYWLTW